jgi:hypothetical protein
MTTIFADAAAGVMVCDSKATVDGSWFPCTKVVRVDDELIGFAGVFHEGERWLEWYRSGKKGPRPKIDNSVALVLDKRCLRLLEGSGQYVKIERGFHGVGSGGACAIAAHMAGADAETAVQIACEIDAGSGGDVVVHSLKG